MYVQEQYIGEEGCLHQGGPKGIKRIKARKSLSCDSEILSIHLKRLRTPPRVLKLVHVFGLCNL